MYYGESIILESLLFNQKDIYKDFNKFESGKSNIVLVTGLSGSGKSTLAAKIANKYKAIHIELDTLEMYYKGQFTQSDLQKYEPGILAFINSNSKYRKENVSQVKDMYYPYLCFLNNWCKRQKDKKFVIEGIQIYDCFDPKDIDPIYKNPIIILGTSAIQSAIRAASRNAKDNNTSKIKEFNNLLGWCLKSDKSLNSLRNQYKD